MSTSATSPILQHNQPSLYIPRLYAYHAENEFGLSKVGRNVTAFNTIVHARKMVLEGMIKNQEAKQKLTLYHSLQGSCEDTYATLRDNMEELKVVADYFEVAKGSKLLR